MKKNGFALLIGILVGLTVLAVFFGIYLAKRAESDQQTLVCVKEFEEKVNAISQATQALNKLPNSAYNKDSGQSPELFDESGNLFSKDDYIKNCLGKIK